MGGADHPVCETVGETDQLGQLVIALSRQSEILAIMMARLEALELDSKETSPVPRCSEVVGQPHKMPG